MSGRTRPARRLARVWLMGLVAAVVLAFVGPAATGRPRDEALLRVRLLIHEWRVEEAYAALQPLLASRARDPEVELLQGELLFLRGEYEAAAERLKSGLEKAKLQNGEAQEVRGLADLAASTAAVTRGFVEARSPGGHFIFRYRRGKDEVLIPYAGEALEKARLALAQDFGGVGPDAAPAPAPSSTGGASDAALPGAPVRVEIYDEVADLARVSTLTLQEIETSGTIALCKWNRLMIVSPKALVRGYPWVDTLTHEYAHFIISRVSRNTVPIWLHEGLAKFEERRWRGASGGGLSPTLESLLAQAVQKKRFITFEQMSPSMAKLPSQEDTALAFAEVYSAVEFLHGRFGWAGLRAVIKDLSQGAQDLRAVAAVYGASFAEFERGWKAWLKGRKLRARGVLYTDKLRFKKAAGPGGQASKKAQAPGDEDDSGEITDPKARGFMRLGGLLRTRRRLAAAAVEYEKAQALLGGAHPLIALKLGRTYLDLGDNDRAAAALEPARELYPDLAGLSAALGTAYLRKGDLRKAVPTLEAAIYTSPFDPSVHCGLASAYGKLGQPALASRASRACELLGPRTERP
ncbi:MAG: peptidase MA family metallohydrolase [Polyangia bacterium]